jgi:hypothetical protein
MDDAGPSDLTELPAVTDPLVRRMLGIFDTPAFARRGRELELRIAWVHARCRHQRADLLAPVEMRLGQWASVAIGPDDWSDCFDESPQALWTTCEAVPPCWASLPASPRRRRSVAHDLIASLSRFNHRWTGFLETFDLAPLNHAIEQYNRYYLFEKECSMGSARLAARHFETRPAWTLEDLRAEYPPIAVPRLRERR